MTTVRYTREELERDLSHLIHDWDTTHTAALAPPSASQPQTQPQPRKPRHIWLSDMTDITDDYPYNQQPLTEAMHDASDTSQHR